MAGRTDDLFLGHHTLAIICTWVLCSQNGLTKPCTSPWSGHLCFCNVLSNIDQDALFLVRTDQTLDVSMVGLWSDISEWTMDFMSRDQPMHALSQDRLDPCHHGWAMDACFQFSVSERIRPWTSCWLSHGCSVLTADSTLLWLGCGCSASQKPLMLSLLGGCSVLDVIMAGPWMLYSQNRLSPGRHNGWALL